MLEVALEKDVVELFSWLNAACFPEADLHNLFDHPERNKNKTVE